MDIDIIKSFLIKHNPEAHLKSIKKNIALYYCNVIIDNKKKTIYFQIPLSETDDSEFKIDMDSSKLINWIQQ